MVDILVLCAAGGPLWWEDQLCLRLSALGHAVALRVTTTKRARAAMLHLVYHMESLRFGAGLASPAPSLSARLWQSGDPAPRLIIDLTGKADTSAIPTLRLTFGGHTQFEAALVQLMSSGQAADIVVYLNDVMVGKARPMLGNHLWLSRVSDDLSAGAITLVVQAVQRIEAGKTAPAVAPQDRQEATRGFPAAYVGFIFRGLSSRLDKKRRLGKRPFYWQVAYRWIEGAGVAENGMLSGVPFTVLPDDGTRFYADPFVVAHEACFYLFVEEFPYEHGRGLISVAELGADGRFGTPRPVLSEPHHLSYPQVIKEGDDLFMIPESSAARELVLYRAEKFPDVWVRDTVLLQDIDINDATLLVRSNRYWLVGTQRFGRGSASDTMVVYSAPSLRGPWTPHAANPIIVDHSAARPGGAFMIVGDRVMLPAQDGSKAYGGGLGLMELVRLDDEDVVFAPPQPVKPGDAFSFRGIHTLNRDGNVEVVDGAG